MSETVQEVLQLRSDGLTQTEVADKLGISQQYVSKIERTHAGARSDDTDESSKNDGGTTDTSGTHNSTTTDVPRETKEYAENNSTNNSTTSQEWTCTKCGTSDWYNSDEYLAAYGENLENRHIALLMKGDKVCAGCGVIS